jgi:uncharacterized protein YutE (UPF0331/DUF86 family)
MGYAKNRKEECRSAVPLNSKSISQRLRRLELYIAELEKQQQTPFCDFQADFTRQLATERAFQAAIETCVDIAAHLVSTYQLGQVQESRDVFPLLVQAGYLTPEYGQSSEPTLAGYLYSIDLHQRQLQVPIRHKKTAHGRALRRDLGKAARELGAG